MLVPALCSFVVCLKSAVRRRAACSVTRPVLGSLKPGTGHRSLFKLLLICSVLVDGFLLGLNCVFG